MPSHRRIRSLSNTTVQGWLILRVLCYWVLCQMGFALGVYTAFRMGDVTQAGQGHPLNPVGILWQSYIFSCFLLPIPVIDMLLFSNRITGPLLRLGRGLKLLAKGDPSPELRFRKGDLLDGLDSDFNAVNARLKQYTETEAPNTDASLELTQPVG